MNQLEIVQKSNPKLVTVQYRDKLNGIYLHQKQVTRATLAKLYHKQLVTHAINGIPVVDI